MLDNWKVSLEWIWTKLKIFFRASSKQLDMNTIFLNKWKIKWRFLNVFLLLFLRFVLCLKQFKRSFESLVLIHFGFILCRCLPFIWSQFRNERVARGFNEDFQKKIFNGKNIFVLDRFFSSECSSTSLSNVILKCLRYRFRWSFYC